MTSAHHLVARIAGYFAPPHTNTSFYRTN